MSSTRRRSFVSKPTFQLKLTIVFMLMVTIVANLVGGLCYLLISEKVQGLLEISAERLAAPDLTMKEIAEFLIPKILLAEGISLAVVFFLSILVTHTIAGPVYRMEKVAKEIGDGNLAIVTRLRPKDEFKELADAFNVMCRGLATRVSQVNDEIQRLEFEEGIPPDKLASLRKALEGFQLPADLSQMAHEEEAPPEEPEPDSVA